MAASNVGSVSREELTTAKLRRWHARVREAGRAHPANRVMSMLTGILTLAEEDCGVRVCAMPTDLAKRKAKSEKAILTTDEVAEPIALARQDTERRIYYAFAFRTDVRVSEQLGLLREDVDRARDVITIRRVQECHVSLTDQTKTDAGEREIPVPTTLRQMLLEWRLRCPRLDGKLCRVFLGARVPQQWPPPRLGGGLLLYSDFLKRYWRPLFNAAGIRQVTHRSARHSFVSSLKAQRIEVGLVARLAGPSKPALTLGHDIQAVRGGAAAPRRWPLAGREGMTGIGSPRHGAGRGAFTWSAGGHKPGTDMRAGKVVSRGRAQHSGTEG